MSDTAQKYRTVFSGPDGESVLDDICRRGGMFMAAASDEERIRENFAKEIFALAAGEEDGSVKRQRYVDVFRRIAKPQITQQTTNWRKYLWIGLRKLWAIRPPLNSRNSSNT